MSIRGLLASSTAAAAVAAVVAIVGAPSAAAAASPSVLNIGCFTGTGLPATVHGAVGDTFSIHNGDGNACPTVALNGVVSGATSIAVGATNVYTILAAGDMLITDELTDVLAVTIILDSAGGAGTGPVRMLQQLPMPASGMCSDINPKQALWGQDITTPWTKAWTTWTQPTFVGWVCERSINSDGTAVS